MRMLRRLLLAGLIVGAGIGAGTAAELIRRARQIKRHRRSRGGREFQLERVLRRRATA